MLQHFTYLAPRTRAELHGVLANEGAAASLLAGGTDLLVNVRAGLAQPKVVVDAKKVEAFAGIAWSEREGLVIRAGATINAVLDDAKDPQRLSAAHRLRARSRLLSDPQSRDGRRQRRQRLALRGHGAGAAVPAGARRDRLEAR